MDPARFFYSTNGTDVHGPVTEDELRQLLEYQVIGSTSFLCPEGEEEWQPLDPETLRASAAPAPRFVPYAAPPESYVPPRAAMRQMRDVYLDELWMEGKFRIVLTVIALLVAIGGAALLLLIQSKGIIALIVTPVLVVVVPYLASMPFKRGVRLGVRLTVRILCIGGFAFFTLRSQSESEQAQPLVAKSTAMVEQAKDDMRQQLAEKRHGDSNLPKADAGATTMADQDDSESSRLMRAAVVISQEILEKVKISTAAEQACGSFDPATLNSLADIYTLRTAISKLRDTQTDVLNEFQNYDDRCRAVLIREHLSVDEINQAIAGARKGEHVEEAINAWQLKIKLSDDHLSRLDFLEKSWGSWNSKDGKLLFSDKDSMDAYNALTLDLQNDVKQLGDLQKKAYQ